MKRYLNCRVFVKKALHFLNILVLPLIIFRPDLVKASDYQVSILSQNQDHVRIKFVFDSPGSASIDGKSYVYKKSSYAFDANGARIPVISEIVHLPGKNATLSIISKIEETQPATNYFVSEANPNQSGLSKTIDIKYLGLYRDVSLFSISILPVRVDLDKKEIRWIKELIIEAKTPLSKKSLKLISKRAEEKEVFKNFILNGNSDFYQESAAQSVQQTIQSNPILGKYSNIFKIKVDETGLYKITYNELIEAEFPIDDIQLNRLAIFNKGLEIPVFIENHRDGSFDSNDYLEFWGEKNEKTLLNLYDDQYTDPFSDINVYWLVEKSSSGLRIIEESGGIVVTNPNNFVRASDQGFEETLHFEQDSRWERFGHDPEYIDNPVYKYDHWFWGGVISSPSTRDYNFNLPHPFPIGNNVKLEAMFRGVSIYNFVSNPIEGHQVSLWLNQQPAGATLASDGWLGQKKKKISNSLPLAQGNLVNGTNKLQVLLNQTGVTDIVLLNWFNITYQRKFRADNEFIRFNLPQNKFSDTRIKQFEIDGFQSNDIEIYKLGISKIVNGKIDYYTDQSQYSSYRITFQDQIFDPDIEYIALTEEAKKKPISIEKYEMWEENEPERSITDLNNSADVLIVTTKLFKSEALRLKSLKEQKGFTVETVDVDQIYDTFNYGIKSPISIKEFFKYVYYNWDQSKKLRYVILTGDGSYDRKKIFGNSQDYVPVIMYSTNTYGAAPSDLQYTLLSGNDMIPDISIGRIPASTVTDLAKYIDKIDDYENSTEVGSWKNKALFISGNDESSSDLEAESNKPLFRAQSSRLINLQLPENIFAYKLNTVENDTITSGVDPEFGSTFELIDYIDDGVSFLNFFGHGGGAIWADKVLFDLDDVDNLNNNHRYPFVGSMTCFTGAFENPNRQGLLEKMLFTENKGAIAGLASASVGWKKNDFALEWPLFDYLWNDKFSFGMAVDFMKISYMASSLYYLDDGTIGTPDWGKIWSSMVNQYNLLGDPTLKLAKPNEKLQIKLSDRTPASGERIQIEIDASEFIQDGVGEIEIVNQENFKYLNESFSLQAGKHIINFDTPQNHTGEILKIKTYVEDNTTDASGFASCVIERSIISSINILPENTQITDSISFEIIANSFKPIASMELRKFRNIDGTGDSKLVVQMEKINDSLFVSTKPLKWTLKAGQSYFEVYIRDSLNKESIYDFQKMTINDSRPDLALDVTSVKYSGVDSLFLSYNVSNISDYPLSNVLITSYINQDTNAFYTHKYVFAPNEKKAINVPFSMDSVVANQKFSIKVDPLNEIEERSENNNNATNITVVTDHFFIDKSIGTSTDGINNRPITIFNDWDFLIEPNDISSSSVLSFSQEDIAADFLNNDQKDLYYVPFENKTDSVALRINSPVSFNATISARVDSSFENVAFFKYNKFLGLWVRIESEFYNGIVTSTNISQNGLYSTFINSDTTKPFVEITANGRSLVPGRSNLVSLNPNIAILLQDENGIYFDSFTISIDGTSLESDDLVLPDSIINSNSIAIVATPQLKEGPHTLDLGVSDINNNAIENISIDFSVSAVESFKVFGNYPNPFKDKTIISFENSTQNELSEIKTRIYSVSGHLIRKKLLFSEELYNDLLRINYHEFEWDGTDDQGNDVANGVYFLVIEAHSVDGRTGKKNTYKRKLKMARLK